MYKFTFIKNILRKMLPNPVDKIDQEYVNTVKECDLPKGLPKTLKPSNQKIVGRNCMGNTNMK